MSAPEHIETERLVLRKPRVEDAESVFSRYASDADVTRLLGWARHETLEQTRAFLDFSASEWERWPAGPYLIEARASGLLLGGTGLAFETPFRASTGYVLAKDAWGRGFATEALGAVVTLAGELGVRRLYALCHREHAASRRVLEKGGFALEGVLRSHSEFPNLRPGEPANVSCYSRILGGSADPSPGA